MREKQVANQERVIFTYDHALLAADTTVKVFSPSMKFQLDRVRYVNPTGLVADAANFFNIQVRQTGPLVMANWSTETGQEGALPANDFVTFTLSTANVLVNPNVDVDILFDETGTQTLPAGRLIFEGRYI